MLKPSYEVEPEYQLLLNSKQALTIISLTSGIELMRFQAHLLNLNFFRIVSLGE
jgi:hypothetical protein